MSIEQSQDIQEYRSKYNDLKGMLADSKLDAEEQSEMLTSYDYECSSIHDEAADLCHELQNEMNVYNQLKDMSREDVRALQRAIGIPAGPQRDGIRGPGTYSQYFSQIQEHQSLSTLSLGEFLTEFNSYEERFKSLDLESRKQLQRDLSIDDDGAYGANTFAAMFQSSTLETTEDEEIVLEEVGVPLLEAPEEIVSSEIIQTAEDIPIIEETPEIEIDTNNDIVEQNELSPEEIKEQLITEASSYQRQLLRALQAKLGFESPDGLFGPISANKAMELHPSIHSIQELFDHYEINTDIDGPLSQSDDMGELQENYLHLYGEYTQVLTENMDISAEFIEAIIWKETTYGKGLNSGSGSKGMMQLTGSAFDDMRGDTAEGDRRDYRKVRRYQGIFRSIDLDALFSVNIGDKGQARERIPSHIIQAFETIQQSENIREIQDNIDILRSHIKGDPHEYDHEANIIIGTVYLQFIHQYRAGGDLANTAFRYNGNDAILSNGQTEQADYRRRVMNRYNQLS